MNINNIISKDFKDVTYDELYYLYITCLYGYDDIAKMFNFKSNINVRRKIKKFNIVKNSELIIKTRTKNKKEKTEEEIQLIKEKRSIKQKERRRLNNIKKYGTDDLSFKEKCNITWNNKSEDEIKEIQNKIKETNIEKYGVENVFQSEEIKEKIKQTNINKYGVYNPLLSDEIQSKIKQANKEKYGNELIGKSKIIQNKIKETNIEKYGVEFPLQSKDIQSKANKTIIDKYNVLNPSQIESVKEKVINKRIDYFNNKYEREKWQSDTLHSKELFEEYLKTLSSKPSIDDISLYLNYDCCTIDKKINEYGLRDYIDFNPKYSSYETEIVTWLNNLNIVNIERNVNILDGKEIDIFLPDYNVGIEFNGNYWHNEYHKQNIYHQNKSLLALSKNIFLYHIFEYEWTDLNKKERILNQLKNILQKNTNKIYARKCEIKIVNTKDKKEFINKYHIQGDCASKINIGLYFNNELISIMTFGISRFNKECKYELIRYCSKANTNIVGGASKIFKYFVDNFMEYGSKCVSYSDISKTKGSIYNTLGFEFIKIEYPNYVWCNGHNILSRYKCQMKNEIDTMRSRNYYRIFDCGTKTWIYTKEEN